MDKLEGIGLNILRKFKLKKLADFYEAHREGMRYLIFGALSTIVNIIVFEIFFQLISLSVTVSNVIAWVAAVIFAYVTNKLIVFHSKVATKKELLREIISFFGARVFTLIVETIFLNIFIDGLGFNSTLMKIISNIIVIIINFVLSKLIVFKKEL